MQFESLWIQLCANSINIIVLKEKEIGKKAKEMASWIRTCIPRRAATTKKNFRNSSTFIIYKLVHFFHRASGFNNCLVSDLYLIKTAGYKSKQCEEASLWARPRACHVQYPKRKENQYSLFPWHQPRREFEGGVEGRGEALGNEVGGIGSAAGVSRTTICS